ncbi:MAG: hypothetical protein LBR83_02765 [Clostridiales bacterium]|nr:hypothetical protein [Clostridiales bacterium]
MNNPDFRKLSREQLLEHFENERKEWLEAGMSEADINRVHFGEENENGRGGDYRVWLNERKHVRPDHKYAPGTPVAIDAVDPDSAWISGGRGGLDAVEFNTDFAAALSKLTELERKYFTEIYYEGLTNSFIARRDGKDESAVRRTVNRAKEKLKKYF